MILYGWCNTVQPTVKHFKDTVVDIFDNIQGDIR